MCRVQLLRVSVHKRLNAAAEDFLLRVETEEEPARVRTLRALLTEQLTAAAEELFALFAETIAEYEDRIERSKREICRQTRLLDAVLKPEVRLHRLDVQRLMVCKEESPLEQQLWGPVVDQEDSEVSHIKMEQSELPVSQEEELHQGLEQTDSIKLTLSLVASKSDEEKPHLPELHQRQVKENREDCEGPEPARNSSPDAQTGPVDKTHVSPESETEDSEDDWRATRDHQSCLNNRSNKLTEINMRPDTAQKPFSCTECERSFARKSNLDRHLLIHRGCKPFSCSECNKVFGRKYCLNLHMRTHRVEQPFSCSECSKVFVNKYSLNKHIRYHREKPFTCSECGKGFICKHYLTTHMLFHKEDKPFSCSECGKGFTTMSNRKHHLLVHRGESQFSCSLCGKRFIRKYSLNRHMSIHFGKKPFSCSECGKRFTQKSHLKKHSLSHKGH